MNVKILLQNLFHYKKNRIHPFDSDVVYRIDVLIRSKYYAERFFGLCSAIRFAMMDYNLQRPPFLIFPAFSYKEAKKFGANTYGAKPYAYWWPEGVWDTGRMDFLNWLIEQYKHDKTNLRKL